MEADVLVDQGEAETGTIAGTTPTRNRAAGKAFEDELALFHGHAGSVVFHRDPHMADRFALTERFGDEHTHRSATVETSVVDEVGQHTRQPPPVAVDEQTFPTVAHGDRCVGGTAHCHRLTHELGDDEFLAVQPHRTCVESRDLEQVGHQALETGDVAHHQVEGDLRSLGHFGAVRLQHLGAGGQRHER